LIPKASRLATLPATLPATDERPGVAPPPTELGVAPQPPRAGVPPGVAPGPLPPPLGVALGLGVGVASTPAPRGVMPPNSPSDAGSKEADSPG